MLRTSFFVKIVNGDPESIIDVNGCFFILLFNMKSGAPFPASNRNTILSSSNSELSSDWSAVCPKRMTLLILPRFASLAFPLNLAILCFLHIRMKYPITPQLRHFSPFALHTDKWFRLNSRPHLVHGFLPRPSIAYTVSFFIVLPPVKFCCCAIPSSKAIANRNVSCGWFFGSVHKRSCIVLLCIFCMNVSMINLSICWSNSQRAARSVSAFQNCRSVSLGCCFREKYLKQSNVLFLGLWNVSSQFVLISFNDAVTTIYLVMVFIR